MNILATNLADIMSKFKEVGQWFSQHSIILDIFFACAWVLVGYIVARIVKRLFTHLERIDKIPTQINRFLSKVSCIIVYFIFITLALSAVGVNVVSMLGAAGVLGVAIGFASQASLSNAICGIFIISERNIRLGDYVRIAGVEGTIEAINLMSVKLRQADNSLIRIPNQTIVDTPLTNITGSDKRRCDFDLGLDYTSDLGLVKSTLLEIIAEEKRLLSTPEPAILFLGFGDSTLNVRVGAWCKTSDYAGVRYEFAQRVLEVFSSKGINMAFPTRSVFVQKDKA